ncbi:MAG: DNA circularization N-terminal domain-containing protein [Psychromonas sp.]
MWERKYEHGRWDGLALNILSTSLDGGQRLQITEIPYADLPDIIVMGSKAVSVGLEVVLIGSNSLVDANALIDSLNKSPRGELEHPWLGELSLTFESSSLSIDTKIGLVTLSLNFIRDARSTKLKSSTVVTDSSPQPLQKTATVEEVSTSAFEQDVAEMGISDMNTLQADFTQLVSQLASIASMLSVPSQILSAVNQEINRAMMSISSIANAPGQFAEQLSTTIESLAQAVRSDDSSTNETVDHSRAAQAMMLDAINDNDPSPHYNIQCVVAAIKMSNDIARLEQEEVFDLVNSTAQVSTILSDLNSITSELDQRIVDATQVSTYESLEVFDALTNLSEGVNAQINKVIKGSTAQTIVESSRFIPALVLAHQSNSSEALVMALNKLQHPLFLKGSLAMRESE